jgi:hypothetical protein
MGLGACAAVALLGCSSDPEVPASAVTIARTHSDLTSVPAQPVPQPVTFPQQHPAVQLSPAREYGVQPGWARAVFNFHASGPGDYLLASVNCATGSPLSIRTDVTALSSSLVAVELRANQAWLANNGFPAPCQVTSVVLTAYAPPALPLATSTLNNTFAMDLPLSFRTPRQLTTPITGADVSLQVPASSRRYVAYPPTIFAVSSTSGRTAFVEVEELPERGTLGLRAAAVFDSQGYLDREFGGSAEIYPGWGVDIDLLGVTKATSGNEETNLGVNSFPYVGTVFPPLLASGASNELFPAPAPVLPGQNSTPTYSEAEYLAKVLDNRGVPRCPHPNGCLDFIYDQANHRIQAASGATVLGLESGPIQAGITWDGVEPTLAAPAGGPGYMLASAASPPMQKTVMRMTGATLSTPPPEVMRSAGTTCPLTVGSNGGATSSQPLTMCSGVTTASQCPTSPDPFLIDAFPSTPGGLQLSLHSMMPQYASRANGTGSCVAHSQMQYHEYLVNKLIDDVAPRRTMNVEGQPVVVPNPLVAFSVMGTAALGISWDGTQPGEYERPESGYGAPALGWMPGVDQNNHINIAVPNAYWPDYESDYGTWSSTASYDGVTLSLFAQNALNWCKTSPQGGGGPGSAFCMGEGQPPPGVYWNYTSQVRSLGTNPFTDTPWSTVDTYFDETRTDIDMTDNAGIQNVIDNLNSGLPVQMLFPNAGNTSITDGPNTLDPGADITWYLPPELVGCDPTTLRNAFSPRGGHSVDIIGYSLAPSSSTFAEYLAHSYFIIDNNWDKSAGYGGYYFMNFGMFRVLANELIVRHLVCSYNSVACAPPVSPNVSWNGQSSAWDQGFHPSVASLGDDMVEVHQAGTGPSELLASTYGVPGPSVAYDSQGMNPVVAGGISPSTGAHFVEEHQLSAGVSELWYHTAMAVTDLTPPVTFGHAYDSGEQGVSPSIAVLGDDVMEVHQSVDSATTGSIAPLLFRTGRINADGTITWSSSQPYDNGVNPHVTLATNGRTTWAVDVHQAGTTVGPLWVHRWSFEPQASGPAVATSQWSAQYDSGINPSIGAHGYDLLEVHQAGRGLGQLWFHQGTAQNGFRASAYPYVANAETPSITPTTDDYAFIEVHHTGDQESLQYTSLTMP